MRDPFLTTKLCNPAWCPIVNFDNLDFLGIIDAVFIRHIHEDYWDIKKMEILNRDIQILIPKMIVKRLIKKVFIA